MVRGYSGLRRTQARARCSAGAHTWKPDRVGCTTQDGLLLARCLHHVEYGLAAGRQTGNANAHFVELLRPRLQVLH